MADGGLYKAVLIDHFRHPRNRGDIDGADIVCRGSNPRCGDEIEVGVFLDGEHLAGVRFRGRGCSVCLASSSMMTEVVTGATRAEAARLCTAMRHWFGESDGAVLAAPPGGLEALAAVREYPARHRCVLLAWEALADALAQQA